MKTVVDLVSSLKTYLLGKDTAVKQAVEATIAPVESDASSSAAAYSVGDQLILNDILYDVTASISISNALVVGTNIAPANDLSTQIGGKQDQIEVTSMPTASASNVGQVLIYIGTTTSTYTSGQSYQSTFEGGSYIWKPSGLPTAAAVSYNGTQSGSSETDVQGAIDDLYSQKRTLETNLTNLGNAAYKTSDSTESSIDNADYIPFYDTSASAKKRILKSNLVPSVNSTLSSSSTSPVQNKVVSKALGTVETIGGTATKAYSKGALMLASTGQLYSVTADISQGGSISSGGNVEATDGIVSQISNISDSLGVTYENNNNVSNVANNLWIEIAKITALPVGTYVVTGFLTFQSTSTTGTRMARFASSNYSGKEIELYPNPNGYTQVNIADIVTITASRDFVVQAKQNSTATMNISGQIKAVRII